MAWVFPMGWVLAAVAFVLGRWLVVRPLGARRVVDVFVPPAARWTQASRARRVALVVSGPAACWALAGAIMTVGLVRYGVAHSSTRVDVIPGGAAAAAGILDGDRIVSIDGAPIDDFDAMGPALAARDDDTVDVVVERAGARHAVSVVLDRGKLKVRSRAEATPLPLGAAALRGFAFPVSALAAQAALVRPSPKPAALEGPVSIVQSLSAVKPGPGDALFALGAVVAQLFLYAVALALVFAVLPARVVGAAR